MPDEQDWSPTGPCVNAGETLMIEETPVLFALADIELAQDLALGWKIGTDLVLFTTAAGNQITVQLRSAAGYGDLGIALVFGRAPITLPAPAAPFVANLRAGTDL